MLSADFDCSVHLLPPMDEPLAAGAFLKSDPIRAVGGDTGDGFAFFLATIRADIAAAVIMVMPIIVVPSFHFHNLLYFNYIPNHAKVS